MEITKLAMKLSILIKNFQLKFKLKCPIKYFIYNTSQIFKIKYKYYKGVYLFEKDNAMLSSNCKRKLKQTVLSDLNVLQFKNSIYFAFQHAKESTQNLDSVKILQINYN